MKIVFMGTPQIAADSLNEISLKHEICAVFTREDKPVGRKQILTASPVKILALEKNIKVYQPKSLKCNEAYEIISALKPDLIVVVAYGRILPSVILNTPRLGCINLHVSLLPKYRGAAPIQWAILNAEKNTGVSIMYINEGVDTGDIIKVAPIQIGENETSGELFSRISVLGARTLAEAIQEIGEGKDKRIKQNESDVSYAPLLTKEQAYFDFNKSAQQVHNLVRGLNPWPVAFFEHEDAKIKVLKTKIYEQSCNSYGTILSIKPLIIACLTDAVELCEVVPSGKGTMTGAAWAAGKRFIIGNKI